MDKEKKKDIEEKLKDIHIIEYRKNHYKHDTIKDRNILYDIMGYSYFNITEYDIALKAVSDKGYCIALNMEKGIYKKKKTEEDKLNRILQDNGKAIERLNKDNEKLKKERDILKSTVNDLLSLLKSIGSDIDSVLRLYKE